MAERAERDLYPPVKALLEGLGFTVRGEVNGCDLVAVRGDELVIVELKRSVNLDLLLQAVDRLQLTDRVYVAVEAPRRSRQGRRWSQVQGLCRRLGLGLIAVHFTGAGPAAAVLFDPEPWHPRPRARPRAALLQEFRQRTGDFNTGGTAREPLITAYREDALRIAAYLQSRGPSAVKAVRAATGVNRAGPMLRRNHYGWFERMARGVYRLTPAGEEALRRYAHVVSRLTGEPPPAPEPAGRPGP
ncbi:MAG: DUF2161 family putative PD-(D/E)XK-type phosphodiesterase [Symbiobacteriaceae bacterium]